jgi:hypothetical protein
MAGAVLGIVGSLFGLGGGGGGGEASVAEVAKRVQAGGVQIVVDEEAKLIAFQIEESSSPPIVFDVANRTLSGVTLLAAGGSGNYPSPYSTPAYYSRAQVQQMIQSVKSELMTHIDEIKAQLPLPTTPDENLTEE